MARDVHAVVKEFVGVDRLIRDVVAVAVPVVVGDTAERLGHADLLVAAVTKGRDHDHAVVDRRHRAIDDRREVRVDLLLDLLDFGGHRARVIDHEDDVHRLIDQRGLGRVLRAWLSTTAGPARAVGEATGLSPTAVRWRSPV